MENKLCRYFGDIIVMTSTNWRHNWFFKRSISSYSVWKTTLWPNHATSVHQQLQLAPLWLRPWLHAACYKHLFVYFRDEQKGTSMLCLCELFYIKVYFISDASFKNTLLSY